MGSSLKCNWGIFKGLRYCLNFYHKKGGDTMPDNENSRQNKKAKSFNIDFSYDSLKSSSKFSDEDRHTHRDLSNRQESKKNDYSINQQSSSSDDSYRNNTIEKHTKHPSPSMNSNLKGNFRTDESNQLKEKYTTFDKSVKNVKKVITNLEQPSPTTVNPYKKSIDQARQQRSQFTKISKTDSDKFSAKKNSDKKYKTDVNDLSQDNRANKLNEALKDNHTEPKKNISDRILSRRRRIAELEKMQSPKEVEASFLNPRKFSTDKKANENPIDRPTPSTTIHDELKMKSIVPKSSQSESSFIKTDSATQSLNDNLNSDFKNEPSDTKPLSRSERYSNNTDSSFLKTIKQKLNLAQLESRLFKYKSVSNKNLYPQSKSRQALDAEIQNKNLNEEDSLNKEALVSLINQKPRRESNVNNNQTTSNRLLGQSNTSKSFLSALFTKTAKDSELKPVKSLAVQEENELIKNESSSLPWQERYLLNRQKKRYERKNAYSIKDYSITEKVNLAFDIFINVVKRLAIIILALLLLLGLFVGGTGLGYFAALVNETTPPTYQEMAEDIARLEQQSNLYYASGEPIASVRSDVVRSIASLDDISPNIIRGLIAIEDEEFFEHPGVNPKATLRAVLQTLISGSGTGGSTLTQQLVKQQMLSNEVTYFRKANEILLALRLENFFTKDEILTAYLNVSPFGRNNNGDNIAGIREAAQGIFGVEPDQVNLSQAAYLVGLPQDPYNYTPYNQYGELRDNFEAGLERKDDVLFSLYRNQFITKEEYEEALVYDITQDFLPPEPRDEDRQSYLYQAIMNGAIEKIMHLNIEQDGYTREQVYADDQWYNEYYFDAEEELTTGGYHVYSTIDRGIYDQLQVSAQAYDDELGVPYEGVYVDPTTGEEIYYLETVQTGIVVIENETGRVLGFVAGTDFENNQIDHAFNMHRSPGSTIKPMAVYAPAVEHDLITPATIIPDTEFVETYNDGSEWRPTNYGVVVSNNFISARTALLRSDNIPAVRVYEGLRDRQIPIIDYMELMGFNIIDSYTEEDTLNLAFSLGGVTTGPTVFEQTRAFTTFANNGQYVDGYYIERIEDSFGNVVFQQNTEPVRVFSEDTNYLMVDMLRDTNTQGTGRFANENMIMDGDWIAKSGISENSKDVWYIASTPAVTIGSWIGYDSQYNEHTIDINDGYGGESLRSQTFWANVVNDLYNARPDIFGTNLTFSQPSSVTQQSIVESTGTLPGTIRTQNGSAVVNGPMREEVFKISNPAPELTYDFMFNASEQDLQRFWSGLLTSIQERRRQEQPGPNSQDSSADPETNEESTEDDPDSDSSNEENGENEDDSGNESEAPHPNPEPDGDNSVTDPE